MRSRATDREVHAVRRLSGSGLSTRAVAELMAMSSGAVSYWLRHPTRLPSLSVHVPPRSAGKAVPRRRILKRLALKLRTIKDRDGKVLRVVPLYGSASVLRSMLATLHNITVTKQTVLSDLRVLGFRSLVKPRVPNTGEEDAKARYAFSRAILSKRFPLMWFKSIIFTDEKIWSSNDATFRRMWVLKGRTPLRRECQRWPRGRIHVYAAIGVGFRFMVVLPAKKLNVETEKQAAFRLTGREFIRRCLSPMVPQLQNKVLQMDGAACHSAKATTKYLNGKGVSLLADWPARSPQLSPIETLFAILQPKVSEHHPQNRGELIAALNREFHAVPTETLDALVMSFKSRLESCVAHHGEDA